MNYPHSIAVLEQDLQASPDTDITRLAKELIIRAQRFDLDRSKKLGVNGRMAEVTRDYNNPPDYTDDKVLGASWADSADQPLQSGEQWNAGRRATLTGTSYSFNQKGYPVNPYMETGLNGRGLLGMFGPNSAVDNGVLVLKDDEDGQKTLYAIGILRKFDNNAPAFSGGFTKYSFNDVGQYIFGRDAVIETQLEEFFEEMISGSIDLLPAYHQKLDGLVADEIAAREKVLQGRSLSTDVVHEIREQTETALKMEQVRDLDPSFMVRLRAVIAKGHECFAGPLLNDNRTTNNAWIESRLSWFLMDDKTWEDIKGTQPVFDYRLSAGDDASRVVPHHIGPDLVRDAYASHGSMFCFMLASYLLDVQKRNLTVEQGIIKQATDITDWFKVQESAPAAGKPAP